jgi:formylglycine-generating enzyme required for sulfatase activity
MAEEIRILSSTIRGMISQETSLADHFCRSDLARRPSGRSWRLNMSLHLMKMAWLILLEIICLPESQLPAQVRGDRRIVPTVESALIPAGNFRMGSPRGEGNSDEHPRHQVYVDAFYMDKYEVSVGHYKECVDAGKCSAPMTGVGCNWGNPERGENYPVNCVDWNQADSYCRWAGKRLPTEAEWEKAARGGAETRYSFGNDESVYGDYAWDRENSGGKDHPMWFIAGRYLHLKKYVNNYGGLSHPVGQKKPNQFGLYDMYGNVWEWVHDWYDENYYENSPQKNPQGPAIGSQHRFTAPGWMGRRRVIRGGSWYHRAGSSRRWSFRTSMWYDIIGFRCAANTSH